MYGQNQVPEEFEGIIEYTHYFSAVDGSVDTARALSIWGTSTTYYYKNGFYKWVYNRPEHASNGGSTHAEIFDPLRNECIVISNDQSVSRDRVDTGRAYVVMGHKFLFDEETLAGYSCKQFFIETVKGSLNLKRKYSYSDQLPLNPEHFSHFRGNSFDFIYPKIKAVPLKILMVFNNNDVVEMRATKVTWKKLDQSVFDIKE